MKRFLVGGCAALLMTTSCSDDLDPYLGGPAGPPAGLALSSSKLNLTAAGPSVVIGAEPRDAAGNTASGDVQFASCDAAKVTVTTESATPIWAASARVQGNLLGASCVTVTAGGFVDSVLVFIAPGSIVITGPSQVLSGTPATYGLEFYAADGTQLTAGPDFEVPVVESLNTLRLPVTAVDELTYDAAGQQPGSVVLRAIADVEFQTVTEARTINIVPGVFGGTLSATSGEPFQDTLTVSAAPGRTWDGDEYVTIGGQVAINWSGRPADAQFVTQGNSLRFMLPVNLDPGTYEVIVFNQGPAQIAEVASSITINARTIPYTTHVNSFPGANTNGARIENKLFPLSFPVVVTEGATATSRSHYTINPSDDLPLTATLSWIDPAEEWDIDLEWINGAFTTHQTNAGRTGSNPEVVSRTVENFEFIRIFTFSAPAAATKAAQMTITSP